MVLGAGFKPVDEETRSGSIPPFQRSFFFLSLSVACPQFIFLSIITHLGTNDSPLCLVVAVYRNNRILDDFIGKVHQLILLFPS